MRRRSCTKWKKYLLLLYSIFVASVSFAQEREISGTITDSSVDEPLPGVNITIKGTSKGTITDVDGNFSITVPSNESILVISYIGFNSEEVQVNDQTVIIIGMVPDIGSLDEVVVIGYGTQKKSDLTGSISSVSSEELEKIAATNVSQALQGRASGVWITSSSGQPGDEARVRIRGISSINRSDPLYVIDGIPVSTQTAEYSDNAKYTASLNSINPADIESIEVLKDASATAIYGSRGANGVILITTKRGKKGDPKVNFSYYKSFSKIQKLQDVMNSQQFVSFYSDLLDNGTLSGNPAYIAGTNIPVSSFYTDTIDSSIDNDWQDLITRTAQTDNYYLLISGASEYSNYSVSMGYRSEAGAVVNLNLERINLRVNSDHKINKIIKLGESLSVSYVTTKGDNASLQNASRNAPFMPIYDSLNLGGYAGPYFTTTGRNEVTNTLAEVNLREKSDIQSRILVNIYGELEIVKGLKYKLSGSGDYVTTNSRSFTPQYDLGADGNMGIRGNALATLNESRRFTTRWILENLLTYQNTFDKHEITLMAGHAAESFHTQGLTSSGTSFPNPEITVPSGATENITMDGDIWEEKLLSFFGRVIYSYDSKYLLTASIRRDGSSRFGVNNKFGTFPSFSLGWKISREKFFDGVPLINDLKLRFGWGQTGNQDGIRKYYPYFSGINTNRTFYVFGTDQVTHFGGTPFFDSANPDVKWETIEQTNLGLDMGLWKNRLTLSADYYIKKTKDMLLPVPLSYHSGLLQGFAEPILNIGRIDNKGIELNISYKGSISQLQYTLSGNLTTIRNETVQLAGSDIEHADQNNIIVMRTVEGLPLSSFYGYIEEGIFQTEEEIANHARQNANTAPGDIKFKDLDGDHVITANDRTYIGKSIPGLIYGFNLDLSYRQFDFSAFFQGVADVQRYNKPRRILTIPSNLGNEIDVNKSPEVLNYWREGNTGTNIPRLIETDPNNNARFSTRFIENAGFLRLRNLQIGYSLPESLSSKINIDRFRIYASFQNVLTFTKYSGLDPEGLAVDEGPTAFLDSYPPPGIITLGVNFDF